MVASAALVAGAVVPQTRSIWRITHVWVSSRSAGIIGFTEGSESDACRTFNNNQTYRAIDVHFWKQKWLLTVFETMIAATQELSLDWDAGAPMAASVATRSRLVFAHLYLGTQGHQQEPMTRDLKLTAHCQTQRPYLF